MTSKQNENEIHFTRFYDAPVRALWEAWTDPEQTAKWWGPRGFSITTHSKDLRVGGHWSYTMHGPDGVDYPNNTIYLEVEENAKLVYDHGGNEHQPPLFRVTVLFSEENGKTKMDITMTLPSKEAAEQTHRFIKSAGGYSTWDRLAEYLDKSSSGRESFVIARSFNAPIDTVFEMWITPEHISQWLAPKGTTMSFIEADIRTGGKSFYRMQNAAVAMYGRAFYEDVKKPHHLTYKQQFCDKEGHVSRHPLAPTWPETMLTHVTFTAIEPNTTLVKVKWEVVGNVTQEEMDTFIAGRSGMTLGWTGSLDKFEDYLSAKTRTIPAV